MLSEIHFCIVLLRDRFDLSVRAVKLMEVIFFMELLVSLWPATADLPNPAINNCLPRSQSIRP